ncbi:MAG: HAD family phosphatase [Bacteroidales bacterium]|nr:HAD family phosphatase [Bacteroidales bacterium]
MNQMLNSHITTIIFDFGGVLLNLDKQKCIETFQQLGCDTIGELIDNYKQKGLFLMFEEGKISNDEFFAELKKMVGPNITNTQLMNAYISFLTGLPQKKLDLILELHKKYKILMLSNINQFIFEYCLKKYFDVNGHTLSDYFDKTYLSYQLGVCKPDRKIYDMMIADSHLIPDQCFYIDDGAANIEVAKQYGFNCYQAKINEDFTHLFI